VKSREAESPAGPARRLGPIAGQAAAGGLAGIAVVAAAPAGGPPRAALILAAAAIAAALVPSWRAAASRSAGAAGRAGEAWLGWAAALGGYALVAVLAGLPPRAALGLVYVLLAGGALGTFAAALGPRAGQLAASGLGLLALGLPYFAGPALPFLGERALVDLALHSPLVTLCGSFAGFDLLRAPSLYAAFPASQGAPFAYPAPALALGAAGAAALGAGAVALGAAGGRRLRGRRLVAPAAAVLLLLAAPDPAAAQTIIPPAPRGDAEGSGFGTRVHLGYWIPQLEGSFKLDGQDGPANRFGLRKNLDLERILILPTFEVNFAWEGTGKIGITYGEAIWTGQKFQGTARKFEEFIFSAGSVLETRYKWRTIALVGEVELPLFDFANVRLITTQRYVKHEVTVLSLQDLFEARDSFETLIPTIGLGADVFIWGVISAYGDVHWIDFRTTLFREREDQLDFFYREWRLGVRLELVEHAHVLVEWYSLETNIKKGRVARGGRIEYDQSLQGVRVQVAVRF